MINNDRIKLHFRRFEFKYLIDKEKFAYLFNDVRKFTQPDSFAQKKPNRAYLVNSLYFDSPSLKAYYEKIDGFDFRQKIRLRAYGQNMAKNIFLEIKQKKGDIVIKDRVLFPANKISDLIKAQNVFSEAKLPQMTDKKTYQDFMALKITAFTEPKIMVTYLRQPLISPFQDLRLTFDSLISASKTKTLKLDRQANYQDLIADNLIFEIKFNGSFPYWLYQLVKKYQLQRQALSKYCLAVGKVYRIYD